ncbi:MAG: hypothetical protein KGL39_31940 [Patescibacteria group bacterium]|nr:hypothetical protein [Patescibacteria group bacterium]
MAKVKFQIVTVDEQEGLPGTDVVSRPRVLDLGMLHLEDKVIIPVVKALKSQAGSDEQIQAWKKEHGIDGWMLCHQEAGSSKRSWGAIQAPKAHEAKVTKKRTKRMKEEEGNEEEVA